MTDQLLEAGMLLAVGMSVVFTFLTLLIGGVHSIAWFARQFPDNATSSTDTTKPYNNNNKVLPSTQTTVNPTIITAITAAVHTHRRNSQ